jgi:hypothetical protein
MQPLLPALALLLVAHEAEVTSRKAASDKLETVAENIPRESKPPCDDATFDGDVSLEVTSRNRHCWMNLSGARHPHHGRT